MSCSPTRAHVPVLSILRPELLEEPIECDDPVPGTLCYFDTLPARICPHVIMDYVLNAAAPTEDLVRDCYRYDRTLQRPVLTYGYDSHLLFMCVPSGRWSTLRDDYEIVWPDELEYTWAYRAGAPSRIYYWRQKFLDHQAAVERHWVL